MRRVFESSMNFTNEIKLNYDYTQLTGQQNELTNSSAHLIRLSTCQYHICACKNRLLGFNWVNNLNVFLLFHWTMILQYLFQFFARSSNWISYRARVDSERLSASSSGSSSMRHHRKLILVGNFGNDINLLMNNCDMKISKDPLTMGRLLLMELLAERETSLVVCAGKVFDMLERSIHWRSEARSGLSA